MPVKFVLGLSTPQMNRDHGCAGVVDNQIRALDHAGYFSQPVAKHHPRGPGQSESDLWGRLPQLADPQDQTASIDARARSYLHANCAHCHVKWGGGNALFQLTWSLPLAETGTLDTPAAHGAFGISQARILAGRGVDPPVDQRVAPGQAARTRPPVLHAHRP